MPINSFLYPGAKVTTGYEVANSCRFDDGSSPHMTITPGSNGNTKIFTASFWVKRGVLGTDQEIIATWSSGNDNTTIRFLDTDALDFVDYQSSSVVLKKVTTRLFRDPNSWYHIVCNIDTNQAVAANRAKIYVNGVQETSFSTNTIYAEDATIAWNKTYAHYIGQPGADSRYLDGYLAEVCVIDGTAYAASDFGEFDSDSPRIWKPKDVSGLTFGTNGFYLDFEDSANLGNDANGGTDLTEANLAATDQASDSPTNNFATANPLLVHTSDVPTFSEGNCKIADSSDSRFGFASTIGVTTAKWYAEYKLSGISGDDENFYGVADEEAVQANAINNNSTASAGNIVYIKSGTGDSGSGAMKRVMSAGSGTDTDDFFDDDPAANDILQIALNKTDGYVFFGINGTWLNSDDPTSSGSGSNGVALPNHSGKTFFFTAATHSGSSGNDIEINFGNPSFSISSGNSDGNGYGNFEYAVPTNYYSLCTKNLAEYG